MPRLGIDISDDQHVEAEPGGIPIDWPQVYASLKQMSGGIEPYLMLNSAMTWLSVDYPAARTAGFKAICLYRYIDNPEQESLASQVDQALNAEDRIPVVIDYELPYGLIDADGVPLWPQLQASISNCCQLVANSGRKTAAYYDDYFAENMSPPFPVMIADIGSDPSKPCLSWQKSWTADVPGIPTEGSLDLDQWLGTDVQFADFFGLVTTPPETEEPGMIFAHCTDASHHEGFANDWLVTSDGYRIAVITPADAPAAPEAEALCLKSVDTSFAALSLLPERTA